jgi:hypothetical protein
MTDIADTDTLRSLLANAGARQDDGLVEPEPDEEGDAIVFVRNGWIRITIAGQLHKLRRPFLGELHTLEQSLESATHDLRELQESLKEANSEDLAHAQRIADEAKGLRDDSARKIELDDESVALAIKAMERNRAVDKMARELRAMWWQQVFKTLTPPGHPEPEEAPSWVEDITLQQRVVSHWRSAPLAHGS